MTQAADEDWYDAGSVAELSQRPIQQIVMNSTRLALTFKGPQK